MRPQSRGYRRGRASPFCAARYLLARTAGVRSVCFEPRPRLLAPRSLVSPKTICCQNRLITCLNRTIYLDLTRRTQPIGSTRKNSRALWPLCPLTIQRRLVHMIPTEERETSRYYSLVDVNVTPQFLHIEVSWFNVFVQFRVWQSKYYTSQDTMGCLRRVQNSAEFFAIKFRRLVSVSLNCFLHTITEKEYTVIFKQKVIRNTEFISNGM